MERDELKGKQTEIGEADMILSPVESGDGILMRVGLYHIGEVWNVNNNIENHANAALYAEAHNVTNRTGMWPADMEARIKELEGAANLMVAFINASPCDPDITAEQTIAYGEMMDNAAARALLNK